MKYKKICKNPKCNKEFETNYSFQKYCSTECKYVMDKENTMKRYYCAEERKKICKVCGKEFVKNKKSWVYCSDECRQRDKKSHTFELECQCCHRIFKSSIDIKKFCTAKCRRTGVKKKVMSMEEVAKRAREEGITYGEYVAKYRV